jgi:hypothetical protein
MASSTAKRSHQQCPQYRTGHAIVGDEEVLLRMPPILRKPHATMQLVLRIKMQCSGASATLSKADLVRNKEIAVIRSGGERPCHL